MNYPTALKSELNGVFGKVKSNDDFRHFSKGGAKLSINLLQVTGNFISKFLQPSREKLD
jgi:hypothetical protein